MMAARYNYTVTAKTMTNAPNETDPGSLSGQGCRTHNRENFEKCFADMTLKHALRKARCLMGVIIPLEDDLGKCARYFLQQVGSSEPLEPVEIASGFFATFNRENHMLSIAGSGSIGYLKFEYPLAALQCQATLC